MIKLVFIFLIISGLFENPIELASGERPSDQITVEGIVVDKETNEPLPGAKIEIKELKTEIYSDFDGKFIIQSFKPGIYTLNASLISYQSKELKEFNLSSPNNSLIIALNP